MQDRERFNEAVETLLDDCSPARRAEYLNPKEQRILVLAQRLRGQWGQAPSLDFIQALRHRLGTRHAMLAPYGESTKQSSIGGPP